MDLKFKNSHRPFYRWFPKVSSGGRNVKAII